METNRFFELIENPALVPTFSTEMKEHVRGLYAVIAEKFPKYKPLNAASLGRLAEDLRENRG